MGYRFDVGPECEFFLFNQDEDGQPTTISTERAGYFDLGPIDLGENARRDMVLTLEDMGYEIKTFKVDGGACANDFLLEFQSDIINMPLYRPECIETTSLGAAYLAGLATGYWKNTDDIISNWQINNIFRPGMDEERRKTLIDGWHRAVKCTLGWAK